MSRTSPIEPAPARHLAGGGHHHPGGEHRGGAVGAQQGRAHPPLGAHADVIVIHDAARPFVTQAVINRAINGDLMECMDLEATHHVHCAQTEDHKEATRAFVDKREPVFKGR